MEQEHITFFSYMSGAALFACLFLTSMYLWRTKVTHPSLAAAALISTVWNIAIAANYAGFSLSKSNLLILEISRYSAWIVALLSSLQYSAGQPLPTKFRLAIHSVWVLTLGASICLSWMDHPISQSSNTIIWSSLILAITGLICVEQLYKNADQYRLIKLWSLTVGGIFAYDIYLFSYSLIFNQIDTQLWQARGAVNGSAALILTLGSLALSSQVTKGVKLAISRPVAFYTTSMTAAGGFLALMAVGGYYVQLYGGSWGSIVQIVLLFLALISIGVVFISRAVRSRLNVWINKNFFSHKYDYRVEWLRLINYLSRTTDAQDFHLRAITAVASLFKSPKGALWLNKNERYVPVSTLNLSIPKNSAEETIDMPFCQALLQHEWVFSPYSPDTKELGALNELLPQWIFEIHDLWLVLPLLTERELLGFMVLTKPKHDTSLTWEDLDLLKTVGRQVASYLHRHQAEELIAESKQFDTFNKLTAFIMHDLKNLISQQALVVENAAKHKDNPAFIEDAIQTIENSVTRMSTLLKKLQQNEPREVRSLDMNKTLIEAIKKCQELSPTPTLRLEEEGIVANADPDHLIMICTHLIKNAQEATASTGFVDVTLRKEGNNAIITVEDNGEGMDSAFIRDRLFKPFVTTKSGKGMGIGVYQAKEFITSLGGNITVESEPKVGSTFTISIPATQG
jgi:putative PEP-CTERM system histidine kinase